MPEKRGIKDTKDFLHYIGKVTLTSGEIVEQAIARLLTEKGHTAQSGDIIVIAMAEFNKEFIYNGTAWEELSDEGLYNTKAILKTVKAVYGDKVPVEIYETFDLKDLL